MSQRIHRMHNVGPATRRNGKPLFQPRRGENPNVSDGQVLRDTVRRILNEREWRYVELSVLEHCGSYGSAATELGMHRSTLRGRVLAILKRLRKDPRVVAAARCRQDCQETASRRDLT